MAKPSSPHTFRPTRAGTWSATAIVLAAMALPGGAMAQDGSRSQGTTERSETRSSYRERTKDAPTPSRNEWQQQRRANMQAERAQEPGWRGRASQAPDTARQESSAPPQRPQRSEKPERRDDQRTSSQQAQPNRTVEANRTPAQNSTQNSARNSAWRPNGANDQQDHRDQDRRDDRRDDRSGWRDGDRNHRQDGNLDRNDRAERRWDRDWRQDRRYDWNSYRKSHRQVYRLNRYYPPYSSYRYRRLSIGFYMNSLFFSSRYLIDDPGYYRLPPAYGPYRWVRYYDDALLVNIYSGEVVDVIHDFFW